MTTPPTTSPRPPRTLVEELSSEVASIWGEVYGDVGPFAYRVWRVTTTWSGGAPGRGQVIEKERVELRCGLRDDGSPSPPQVLLAGSFSRALNGTVDEGEARVEKLDPTYTEADLCDFGRVVSGEESFFEIRQDGRDGAAPDRPLGRYILIGRPVRGDYARGWTLRLRAQEPGESFGEGRDAQGY